MVLPIASTATTASSLSSSLQKKFEFGTQEWLILDMMGNIPVLELASFLLWPPMLPASMWQALDW